MPCLTYPEQSYVAHPDSQVVDILKKSNAELEAALCAVMTACEHRNINPILWIDYKESGITRDKLESWWEDHKQKDKDRRIKENALAKLSAEERKVLGITE